MSDALSRGIARDKVWARQSEELFRLIGGYRAGCLALTMGSVKLKVLPVPGPSLAAWIWPL
jgi:hypothetical protein